MTEHAPSPEFRQSQIGSFVIQLERALRTRGVDTQEPKTVRETLEDKDFWYGNQGIWTRFSSRNSPPEKAQELVCTTLVREAQELEAGHPDVQSLRRMLNMDNGITLDNLKIATGGTPEGGERIAEPVDIFKTPHTKEEKLPRYRDRDEQIAYRTYQEAWNPNPAMANRVDYWFENERARLRAQDNARHPQNETRKTSEKQEAKPALRWLLDEINSALQEKGVDLNDRTQVEAQIRSEQFWLGAPESFWDKQAEGSRQKPEDFQEQKCREVLEDIRTRRDGHNDRTELRALFGLPPDYRFDLYDLIDVTNGFITHSQLMEQEARQIENLRGHGWVNLRGSLEPVEAIVSEPTQVNENLTTSLREALLKAQEGQSRADKVDRRSRERQKRDTQIRRAQELRKKFNDE